MNAKINEFTSIYRNLRHQYEIFSFTNNSENANTVLKLIEDIQKMLPSLRESIESERDAVNYYEKEYAELERLLAPNILTRRERKHRQPSYLKRIKGKR